MKNGTTSKIVLRKHRPVTDTDRDKTSKGAAAQCANQIVTVTRRGVALPPQAS